MATKYVSTTGSNGANGNTTGTAYQTLGYALTQVGAGDTILMRGGTYPEHITSAPAGTSWSNKVIIANYPSGGGYAGSGCPILGSGEEVWINGSGTNTVDLYNTERYIEWDGINVDGSNADSFCIHIEGWAGGNAHHIRWKNSEIKDSPFSLVMISNVASGLTGSNEFINNHLHGGGYGRDAGHLAAWYSHGFYLQMKDNLISGNRISDFGGGGVHVYNGDGQTSSDNVICYNIIHDAYAESGGQKWGVIDADTGLRTQIYGNVIYGMPNNGGGATMGILAYVGTNCAIYNNTVYGNGDDGIIVQPGASGTLVRNNVCYGNAGTQYRNDAGGSTTADHNSTSGTNPLFVNTTTKDFHLQAGSPLIGAGTPHGAIAHSDIGAFQYVAPGGGGGDLPGSLSGGARLKSLVAGGLVH
jgi:parallel beta-helix repeat protein